MNPESERGLNSRTFRNVRDAETNAASSVRNGLGALEAPRGNCQEDWTGPDDDFCSVPSWAILDCWFEIGPRAPHGETLLCCPKRRTIGDGSRLQIPDNDGRDLQGPAGICGDLWGLVGTCRYLWGSVKICGHLRVSAGISLASRSETFCNLLVGPRVCPRPTAISPGQNSLQD